MDENKPISLDIALNSFIRYVWMKKGDSQPDLLIDLFVMLKDAGCDYYELMSIYSEHSFSEPHLCMLASVGPAPRAILPITLQNIRKNIYRWSPSQYHTDRIEKVVDDIARILFLDNHGMTIYNSNQNPRRKNALNDRYILLITDDKNLFIDISRKTTIQFEKE